MTNLAKLSSANRWTVVVAAAVVIVATALGVAALTDRDTMMQGRGAHAGWSDDPGGRMPMRAVHVAGESDFLAEMIAHHREAVESAGELQRSDRADMRALGEAIVRSQSAQIRQMEAWLRSWYPEQPAADYRPMMRDLASLSGDELDRAFLRDMIGHHMAAVMMSQHLLLRGTEHDDVAELARSIRDDQHDEIIQMQSWLSDWFDEDWRGGMGMMWMSRR